MLFFAFFLLICDCIYREKQKEAQQASGASSRPKTRLDNEKAAQKRQSNNVAVRKHRAKQSAQKKRRTNEKRMARYYQQKEEERVVLQAKTEKAVQAQLDFQSTGCPYPNEGSFKRAVRRVRQKFTASGRKFVFLFKGLVKTADHNTRKALSELNVTAVTPQKTTSPTVLLQTHIASIKGKRDKQTLLHKRRLAAAFQNDNYDEVGFSKRFMTTTQEKTTFPYTNRTPSSTQALIQDFFKKNATDDPCRAATKKQLLKPVSELHKDFVKETNTKVSLRSFHRHKPRNIASVKRLKFRQCLCEVCLNPKLKLRRLTVTVRELLNESLCEFEDAPRLLCVDRKCSECGVERVGKRLRECLGKNVGKKIGWSKWENVKEGKSSRMDKVMKSGTVDECVSELLQELGPLSRHVFTAEWQRKQLQSLKADR